MTSTDRAALKALAETCLHFTPAEYPSRGRDVLASFHAACTPEKCLALLAEVERLEGEFAHARHARNKAGVCMFAFIDWLKSRGETFDSWPDAVKDAFSKAIIDERPLTEAEMARARELFPALAALTPSTETT